MAGEKYKITDSGKQQQLKADLNVARQALLEFSDVNSKSDLTVERDPNAGVLRLSRPSTGHRGGLLNLVVSSRGNVRKVTVETVSFRYGTEVSDDDYLCWSHWTKRDLKRSIILLNQDQRVISYSAEVETEHSESGGGFVTGYSLCG